MGVFVEYGVAVWLVCAIYNVNKSNSLSYPLPQTFAISLEHIQNPLCQLFGSI